MILQEGDFELNGEYLPGQRGRAAGLYLMGFVRGHARDREQDTPNPFGDTMFFGRDRRTPPRWEMHLRYGHGDQAESRANLSRIAGAWYSAPRDPGELSVLRYRLGGKLRRVYGRPRNFQPDPEMVFSHGRIVGKAEFQQQDHLFYDDAVDRLDLQLAKPSSGGGFIFPITFPAVSVRGDRRQGLVVVGGDAPTPPTVAIYGPIANPVVSSAGWRLELRTTLAYDRWVTIDPRAGTVLRNDGVSLAGALTRASYLPDVLLAPGTREIIFSGTDATGTARARVTWHNAYHGI